MMRCTAMQLDFFQCQVWNGLSAEEYKKWCKNISTVQKTVTQMNQMRCTASLTFFNARFGMASVLRNVRSGVKT